MNTTEELEDLIGEAADAMWGTELAVMLERALALALDQGDESGEYRVRLLMGNNAQMTGDTDRLLTNFAWCLAKHDEDPGRFPIEPDEGIDLMWQFKWMVGVLGADPQFSTEQINAVMDDMEAHYRRANLGLSGVAMARFEAAFSNGHLHEAHEAYATLGSTARDEYSHCDACVRSVAMDYHFSTGEHVKGIAEFKEIMDGGYSCGEEPENAMSVALIPLLRSGDTGGLASLHRRSYREARGNADNVGIIANHVAFCAVTGNEARGVALAERHLAWLAHDPLSHRKHLNFLTALGLLLEKLVSSGHGDIVIRGTENTQLDPFFGQRSGVLSAAELAPLCWSAAEVLAADFDTRNDNEFHGRQIAERRAMVTESHPLELGSETFNSPAAPAIEQPASSDEWQTLAIDLATTGQFDAALAACASGVRGTQDPRELAALHNVAIGVHAHVPGENSRTLLRAAVVLRAAALRAAGDEELAGLTERTAELLAGPDTNDSNEAKLALVETELPALAHHPEARYILNAERGHIMTESGQLEQARAALAEMDQAITEWSAAAATPTETTLRRAKAEHSSLMLRLGIQADDLEEIRVWLARNLAHETSVVRKSTSLGLRARLVAQDGDLARALTDAEDSTDLLLGLGARETVAQSVQLSAAILHNMGRIQEYRARLRFGIQQAQLAESPYVLGLAHMLARDLVEHGANDEAIELLDETLNNSGVEIGSHDRGELYDLLGSALRGAEELGGALNAWALGIECFEANEEADRAAQLHLAISSTYREAGYPDRAAEGARAAVDGLAAAMAAGDSGIEPQSLVAAHMQLAEALSLDGDDGALAAIEAANTLAVQADSPAQAAEIQLIRARHLFRDGEVDGAVAQTLQASSALDEIDDVHNQSMLALLQAAHMLDNAKRHDDAAAIYRSVIEALEGDSQGQEIVRHQLADCLEAAGRSAEAVAVRTEAEAQRRQ